MPGMAGPETLSTIRETYPSCRVAVISGSDDPSNLPRCMSIGLSGFIPKHLPTREIVEALEVIIEGRTFVPRSATRRAEWKRPERQIQRSSRPFSEQQANITPRQRHVLAQIAEGLDDDAIAKRLGLSPQTVAIHVAALQAHLGADARSELAEAAKRLVSALH
jgi:DNA-binding NarL/FixJ family response regulator